MAPMVFMPLLRETCPSGPNMIIKNISTKVFRCKLLDDVMRYAGVRCTRRGDAMQSQGLDVDLLSWYANYFTRFKETVASDEWLVARKGRRLRQRGRWREIFQREALAALRGVTAVSLPLRR